MADETKSKSNKKYILVGFFVAILLILAFILLANQHVPGISGPGSISGGILQVVAPISVTVSGTVTTSGSGTTGTSVIFTSSSGSTYPATTSGGSYSITLPNKDTYSATVQWSGQYSWQTGSCNAGSFSLNNGPGATTQQQNFNCDTPSSTILVSGTIHTTGLGTSPSRISFILQNGQTFDSVPTNGAYQVQLPNTASYSVLISWRGLLGVSGECKPLSYTLSQGIGSNSVSQDWTC